MFHLSEFIEFLIERCHSIKNSREKKQQRLERKASQETKKKRKG